MTSCDIAAIFKDYPVNIFSLFGFELASRMLKVREGYAHIL